MGDATSREGARSGSFALSVLYVHLLLVTCFGQAYAKLAVGPIYPTEVALGLALLGSAGRLRDVPWDWASKLIAALCVLAAGWVLVHGLGEAGGAGTKAFSFFIYSGFFFVVRAMATTAADRERLLNAVTVAAIIGAAIGLWQMQSGEPLLGTADFEITSTGSTRWLGGEFALYGMFAAMIVLVRAAAARHLGPRAWWVLGAATCELVLAQHRSGFLAFAVAVVATAALLLGSAQGLRRVFKLLLVLAVAIALLAWLSGGSYIDETIARIASTSDTSDVNIDWRLLSWYEVFDGVRAAPLGHGFAIWDFLFTQDNPLTGSHNSYLDLAYRIGIPGLLLFLAIPVAFIRRTRTVVKAHGINHHLVAIAMCGCILAYLVFASFNVVFETPYMSIYLWIFLGIGTGALDEARVA